MDDLTTMLHSLKQSGLTAEERDALRTRIRLFMDAHPAQAPQGVHLIAALENFFALRPIKHTYRVAALASFAFIFIGFGTSYAAERALPGDPLYGVKIHINEPVLSVLATTPSAQAQWNAQLATRRLEEAEALAATGKLTPVTATDLQTQITQATQHFDASVATVANEGGSGAAQSAATDMQATLDAHADVLAQIAASVPDARTSLAPILSDVVAQANSIPDGQSGAASDLNAAQNIPAHRRTAAPMRSVASPLATSTSTDSEIASSSDATIAASTSVDIKREEIESGVRAWLQSTVGVTLPIPRTEIGPAYDATNTDATTSAE